MVGKRRIKKMRAAFNDIEVMKIDDELVGFGLGADFCAEHELGIKELTRTFKIDIEKIGVDGRKINCCPDKLLFQTLTIDRMTCHILALPYETFFWDREDIKLTKDDIGRFDLRTYKLKENGITTAWDSKTFAILVTDKYKSEIEELYNAFKNLDICVGVAPSQAFRNGGLIFCIISKLPNETVKSMKEADLDYIALQKAAKKTKIKKILEKAGKKYFALSPRWKDESKKEVVFWLNPWDQENDNCGWFTVQDLKDWTKGIGKIPMKK